MSRYNSSRAGTRYQGRKGRKFAQRRDFGQDFQSNPKVATTELDDPPVRPQFKADVSDFRYATKGGFIPISDKIMLGRGGAYNMNRVFVYVAATRSWEIREDSPLGHEANYFSSIVGDIQINEVDAAHRISRDFNAYLKNQFGSVDHRVLGKKVIFIKSVIFAIAKRLHGRSLIKEDFDRFFERSDPRNLPFVYGELGRDDTTGYLAVSAMDLNKPMNYPTNHTPCVYVWGDSSEFHESAYYPPVRHTTPHWGGDHVHMYEKGNLISYRRRLLDGRLVSEEWTPPQVAFLVEFMNLIRVFSSTYFRVKDQNNGRNQFKNGRARLPGGWISTEVLTRGIQNPEELMPIGNNQQCDFFKRLLEITRFARRNGYMSEAVYHIVGNRGTNTDPALWGSITKISYVGYLGVPDIWDEPNEFPYAVINGTPLYSYLEDGINDIVAILSPTYPVYAESFRAYYSNMIPDEDSEEDFEEEKHDAPFQFEGPTELKTEIKEMVLPPSVQQKCKMIEELIEMLNVTQYVKLEYKK